MRAISLVLLLAACVSDKEASVLQEILDASFTVTGPEGLGVCSDDPVVVTGTIDPRYAGEELGSRITVDGDTAERALAIDTNGGWQADISDQVTCEAGGDDCTVEVTVYIETTDQLDDEPLATSASTSFTIAQDTTTFYADADDDGFGDDVGEALCPGADGELPGYVLNGTDCDDDDPSISPAAGELCNDVDDDCDGEVDEGFQTEDYYPDADGDGFGDETAEPTATCTGAPPEEEGWVLGDATDCNDALDTTYPGADEVCDDGEDNDCDGLADDLDPEGPVSKLTYYLDEDGDGFYASEGVGSCEEPLVDYVTGDPGGNGDCDDTDPDVNPGEAEVCLDGIDNNCNGFQDDDDPGLLTGTSTFATDNDGDGFVPTGHYAVVQACEAPPYTVAFDPKGGALRDCDDSDPTLNPGDLDGDGFDTCYSKRIDCDDDPKTGAEFNWSDEDGDGSYTCDVNPDCDDDNVYLHGLDLDGDTYTLCDPIPDCNDQPGFADVYPGAPETVADGIDQDCDGLDACYFDDDGDGYGDDGPRLTAVDEDAVPAMGLGGAECDVKGLSSDNTDCRDDLPAVNPDPTTLEVCGDFIDNDCDGTQDDDDDNVDPYSEIEWMTDADSDGYPLDTTTTLACSPPLASVPYDPLAEVDCDDGDGALNHDDADGDGYDTCDATPDCDDTDEYVNPGAAEVIGDLFDQDCDGFDDCYQDADDDGFGSNTVVSSASAADGFDCYVAGDADNNGDCDDALASINPFAPEVVGDDIDQDCDLLDDCYDDGDGDDEGGTDVVEDAVAVASASCADLGNGLSSVDTDCNDGDPTINNSAVEGVADGIDQDCDNLEDCYEDDDEDDFGTSVVVADAVGAPFDCEAVAGYSDADDDDCDDTNAAFYPGGEQYCTGVVEGCERTDDLVVLTDNGSAPDGTAAEQIEAAVASGATSVEICDGTVAAVSLAITNDIDLSSKDGLGAVLEPSGDDRILDIVGANVTITDVDLENPSATYQTTGDGGLVRLNGGSLTLTDITLRNGRATGDGGGIAALAGDVIWDMGDCVGPIVEDAAGGNGGCVALSSGTTLSWNDGTCNGHTAAGDGGCLSVSAGAEATLDAVNLESNEATSGGGLFVAGTLYWPAGTCVANAAGSVGGCGYVAFGQAALGESGAGFPGPLVLGNTAASSGNAFYSSGDLELVGGDYTHNSLGGAPEDIYVFDGLTCWGQASSMLLDDASSNPYEVYSLAEFGNATLPTDTHCDNAGCDSAPFTCDGVF